MRTPAWVPAAVLLGSICLTVVLLLPRPAARLEPAATSAALAAMPMDLRARMFALQAGLVSYRSLLMASR